MLTLWPINDTATADIMADFYSAARAARDAPEASLWVQREWLIKLRAEHGLVAAVRLADAFIMSSQGPVADH